jgi:hypothetical protein
MFKLSSAGVLTDSWVAGGAAGVPGSNTIANMYSDGTYLYVSGQGRIARVDIATAAVSPNWVSGVSSGNIIALGTDFVIPQIGVTSIGRVTNATTTPVYTNSWQSLGWTQNASGTSDGAGTTAFVGLTGAGANGRVASITSTGVVNVNYSTSSATSLTPLFYLV